eukprot:CAMPEP_0113463388 /NCGR_PEP_ID=MMETSP0014_2-20120614/12621_1 /TAXON_ID=2857 /ORGANISM="Nitzschia sp." /LENGTH=173 /DNA_ID=CAMNT_0000355359 /DNA_START=156 /DNA_END=678 /DNA_ORIENTATION=- /assembly_acc=CAM_ASM_000159
MGVVSEWKRYIDGTTENGSDTDEDQRKQAEREENESEQIVPSFAFHTSDENNPHSSNNNHDRDGNDQDVSPINSEAARRELKDFGRGYYHHLVNTSSSSRNAVNDVPADADESSLLSQADRSLPLPTTIDFVSVATTVGAGAAGTWSTSNYNQYETDPDLRIPVNGEFLHLAQ